MIIEFRRGAGSNAIGAVKDFRLDATYALTATKGDIVKLNGSGDIIAAATNDTLVLGVFEGVNVRLAVETSPTGKVRTNAEAVYEMSFVGGNPIMGVAYPITVVGGVFMLNVASTSNALARVIYKTSTTVEVQIIGRQIDGAIATNPQLGPAPSAPTGLTATAGNAQVALSWNTVSGATSYSVKRSIVSGGPYTTTVISGVTGISYTDVTAVNGTTYYYVVTASNGNGESAASSQASGTPSSAPVVISKPSLFLFGQTIPFTITYDSGTMVYSVGAYDVAVNKPTGKAYYVNAATGVDTNDGLTAGTALRTVLAAYNKGDVVRILIDGIFDYASGMNGTTVAKNISIEKAPAATTAALSGHVPYTWTKTAGKTNVWQTSTATLVARMYDSNAVDVNGDFQLMVAGGSITSVDTYNTNGGGAYYHDTTNSILYVSTVGQRPADDKVLVMLQSVDTVKALGDITIYTENVKYWGGLAPFTFANTAVSQAPKVYGKNCEFKYGYSDTRFGGFGIQGVSLVILQGCIASRNYNDGFNYKSLNSVITNSIEIDCKGFFNGSVSDSDNGSTTHSSCKAIRINCRYFSNKGGNVADIDTATQSWNIGVESYSSTSPSVAKNQSNFIAHTDAEMWLEGCISYGSTYATTVENNGKIHVHGGTFTGAAYAEGTGLVDTY